MVWKRKKALKHFALGAAENILWKKVPFELAFVTTGRNRSEGEGGQFRREGGESRGTEAGGRVVSPSSHHTVSAAVAKFHCHATITIFATSVYHLFMITHFLFKLHFF